MPADGSKEKERKEYIIKIHEASLH